MCLIALPCVSNNFNCLTDCCNIWYFGVQHVETFCFWLKLHHDRSFHDLGSFSCSHLTAKPWLPSQASPCGICGVHSGTDKRFPISNSVFPCQYHSTNAPYSFIHLLPTLYTASLNNRHYVNTYVYIECYLLNADWSEECSGHYTVVQYNKTCDVQYTFLFLDFRQCDLASPTVMPCIQFWTHLVK
jgi:hypothetical protein